jgi:hypothetical protein
MYSILEGDTKCKVWDLRASNDHGGGGIFYHPIIILFFNI